MRITVTGVTGRVGGQVVRRLARSQGHDVVGLARRSVASSGGARFAIADYGNARSVCDALRGTDTLVFVSSDGEAARVLTHHRNVIRAAVENDVAHVVYLSGLDADLASPFCYAYTNGITEEWLAESGLSVSVVRAGIFTEFFLKFVVRARGTGQIRLPAADGRLSLVSVTDVAHCLAALAISPSEQCHGATGPQALNLHQIAQIASQQWQEPIRYVDVPPAEFVVDQIKAGEDPWWTYAFTTMFASVRQQRWAEVSYGVRDLTAEMPASFGDMVT